MEIGYVGQLPHVKTYFSILWCFTRTFIFGKRRKMVRIITTDEREENIYVLNYLSRGLQLNYFNGHMFEYARKT